MNGRKEESAQSGKMTRLRDLLVFHVAFLLVGLCSCQLEDDALTSDDADNLANDYIIEDEGILPDYIDNRIDSAPTYVTPVERFIKAVITPFGWISQAAGAARNTSETPRGAVGSLISGITKPIRDFVAPSAGRARGGFGEVLNLVADRFRAIYPGTEWCGAGNIAKNSEEVGLFKNTDLCCRAHDQCTASLTAGASDYGLRNNGIFTRSHCLCDAKFYQCLKEARSLVATNIGLTYFNVLRPQCFKKEYPAYCIRYGRTRLRNNKCLDYDYDQTQNKTWQWFDSPDFL